MLDHFTFMNGTSISSNKILVVGINPSRKTGKSKTLARLHVWMKGIGVNCFSFTNVIHQTGVYKKSDIDYNFLESCCRGYEKVIALGGFASSALASINIPHHTLPHPSPLNRKLNDKTYEADQLKLVAEYIHGTHTIL